MQAAVQMKIGHQSSHNFRWLSTSWWQPTCSLVWQLSATTFLSLHSLESLMVSTKIFLNFSLINICSKYSNIFPKKVLKYFLKYQLLDICNIFLKNIFWVKNILENTFLKLFLLWNNCSAKNNSSWFIFFCLFTSGVVSLAL